MKPGLDTQLSHLLELLDGAVQKAYTDAGLIMRPRYTPVIRALIEREPSSIGQIAKAATLSQPSATQTIALMVKDGMLTAKAAPGDARRRLIRFTKKARLMLPELQACWAATKLAADSLENDLRLPLSEALGNAIAELEKKSFDHRISEARTRIT